MTFELLPKWRLRRLEWCVAIFTAGYGMFLGAAPASMDSPAYAYLLKWMLEARWGDIFLVVGLSCFCALVINGHAPWTPFVRFITSCLNLLLYLLFAYGFHQVDPWSTAVYVYSGWAVLAGLCVESSVKDCLRLILKVPDAAP